MNIAASFLHPSRIAGRRSKLRGILALIVAPLFSQAAATQQPVQSKTNTPQISKLQPQLQEAEDLLRQGLIEQAREKIQEALERNPSSVEGYNLLGIIYGDQKDYATALEAFQHALKLDPNSTTTRNNLGNVYVAQERSHCPLSARSPCKR